MKDSKNRLILGCTVMAFVLALAVVIYGFFIEPGQVVVHHVWVNSNRLAEVFGEKTVVQISDLHIQKIGRSEAKLLALLDELKPAVIFLTGDYVKWKGDNDGALDFLSRLKAEGGVWGVLGDYDYSDSRKSCLFCHEFQTGKPTKRHAVKILRNSVQKLELPGGAILIGGVDLEGEGTRNLKEAANFLSQAKPDIILSHSPLLFDIIDDKSDVLVLSGDTHGGQIALPRWLWKVFGYKKNAIYERGLFQKGAAKMFVNQGLGTSHIPFRFLRSPEVVVLHFMANK